MNNVEKATFSSAILGLETLTESGIGKLGGVGEGLTVTWGREAFKKALKSGEWKQESY